MGRDVCLLGWSAVQLQWRDEPDEGKPCCCHFPQGRALRRGRSRTKMDWKGVQGWRRRKGEGQASEDWHQEPTSCATTFEARWRRTKPFQQKEGKPWRQCKILQEAWLTRRSLAQIFLKLILSIHLVFGSRTLASDALGIVSRMRTGKSRECTSWWIFGAQLWC